MERLELIKTGNEWSSPSEFSEWCSPSFGSAKLASECLGICRTGERRKMALVAGLLIVFCVVVVAGALAFQILPRIFPSIKKKLPSQSTISYIQLVPVSFLLAAKLYLFFDVFLHLHVEKPFGSWRGLFHIAFVFYMWTNVVFNYYAAVFLKPGYPQHQKEYLQNRSNVKRYEMCARCERIRSFGTHHCSWCDKCVEMMCHHCPFTNNCVGLRNYTYYYLFLGYAFFGLIYAAYLTFFPFWDCVSSVANNTDYIKKMLFPKTPYQAPFMKYAATKPPLYQDILMKAVYQLPPGICQELGLHFTMFLPVVFIYIFIALLFIFQSTLLLLDMSMVDFYDAIGRSTSVGEFFKILKVGLLKKRKARFETLVWNQRSSWWRFFIPSFNDVTNSMPMKDM